MRGLWRDLRAYLEWRATARVGPGEPDWGDDQFYRYLLWRGRKTTQAPLHQRIERDRKAGGRVERQRQQIALGLQVLYVDERLRDRLAWVTWIYASPGLVDLHVCWPSATHPVQWAPMVNFSEERTPGTWHYPVLPAQVAA